MRGGYRGPRPDLAQWNREHSREKHSHWKGDNALPDAGRYRANKLYNFDSCQICNSKKNIGIHHKDKNPMNNNPENVVGLCKSCHARFHINERKEELREITKKLMPNRKRDNFGRFSKGQSEITEE